MTAVLGSRPPANNQEIDDFDKRIAKPQWALHDY